MSNLKRRMVWNQAALFIYFVVIFGLPYLWISVDLAESQVISFLIVYVIEASILVGLFVLLTFIWARPLLSLERAVSDESELDFDSAVVSLQLGAKLPAKLALGLFFAGYGILALTSLP